MTRDERIAWAKQRALEYVDRGELDKAVAWLAIDLSKHPELDVAPPWSVIEVGMRAVVRRDGAGVRRWIEDFR